MTKRAISTFRGISGEVLNGIAHPAIWLTGFPLIATWLLIGTLVYKLTPGAEIPQWIIAAVLFLINSCMIGRYALAGAQGEIHAGFYSNQVSFGEAGGFALRHLVFTIIWEIPIIGVMYMLDMGAPHFSLSPGGGGMGMPDQSASGFLPALSWFVSLLCVIGPGVAAVLATATSTLGQVFSLTPWKWLWYQRKGDIMPYIGAICGGAVLFLALYAPILILIAFAFAKGAASAQSFEGMMLAMMLPLIIPATLNPILFGRLAGAFVYGEDGLGESAAATNASPTPSSAAAKIKASSHSADVPAEGSTQPKPTTPMSSAQNVFHYEALAEDPSEAIISWSKKHLSRLNEALAGYVFRRVAGEGSGTIVLGVQLDPNTKLGARQKILKELNQHKPPCKVMLLDERILEELGDRGLLIYKKKSGS